MSIHFKYKTRALDTDVTSVDVHIGKKVDVKLFSPNEQNKQEFLVIESIDLEANEWAQVFIHNEALDQFVEQMSAVCALRFKKSNP